MNNLLFEIKRVWKALNNYVRRGIVIFEDHFSWKIPYVISQAENVIITRVYCVLIVCRGNWSRIIFHNLPLPGNYGNKNGVMAVRKWCAFYARIPNGCDIEWRKADKILYRLSCRYSSCLKKKSITSQKYLNASIITRVYLKSVNPLKQADNERSSYF